MVDRDDDRSSISAGGAKEPATQTRNRTGLTRNRSRKPRTETVSGGAGEEINESKREVVKYCSSWPEGLEQWRLLYEYDRDMQETSLMSSLLSRF